MYNKSMVQNILYHKSMVQNIPEIILISSVTDCCNIL